MMNRRDMLAAGLLGALAPAGERRGAEHRRSRSCGDGLKKLDDQLDEFKGSVDQGLRGNSMNFGGVGLVKNELQRYLKASGKFPEYCDIGVDDLLRHLRLARAAPAADPDLAARRSAHGDSVHVHAADAALGERRELRRTPYDR